MPNPYDREYGVLTDDIMRYKEEVRRNPNAPSPNVFVEINMGSKGNADYLRQWLLDQGYPQATDPRRDVEDQRAVFIDQWDSNNSIFAIVPVSKLETISELDGYKYFNNGCDLYQICIPYSDYDENKASE